jgi:hypothetical protein
MHISPLSCKCQFGPNPGAVIGAEGSNTYHTWGDDGLLSPNISLKKESLDRTHFHRMYHPVKYE